MEIIYALWFANVRVDGEDRNLVALYRSYDAAEAERDQHNDGLDPDFWYYLTVEKLR